MALRRCWRYASGVPKCLVNSDVLRLPSASKRALSSLVASHLQRSCPVITTRNGFLVRRWSSLPSTDVTYEQLKMHLAGRTAIVIDVREPWELREYGSIPGSINVPLGQVNVALQLEPEEFKEKYGGDMPQQAANVVFSCLAGVRSKKALDTAAALGYSSVQHYPGGWQEWAKLEQLN